MYAGSFIHFFYIIWSVNINSEKLISWEKIIGDSRQIITFSWHVRASHWRPIPGLADDNAVRARQCQLFLYLSLCFGCICTRVFGTIHTLYAQLFFNCSKEHSNMHSQDRVLTEIISIFINLLLISEKWENKLWYKLTSQIPVRPLGIVLPQRQVNMCGLKIWRFHSLDVIWTQIILRRKSPLSLYKQFWGMILVKSFAFFPPAKNRCTSKFCMMTIFLNFIYGFLFINGGNNLSNFRFLW